MAYVRKRGEKWYYAFETAKINGKRHRIERIGGDSKKEAEKALRKALNQYENGAQVEFNNNMSFNDYLDFWFDNFVIKKLKKNTQSNYQNVLNNYLKPTLGYYHIKNLTPRIIEDFSQSLLDKNLANHTMEIIISVIKKSLRMAVFPYELLTSNPAEYTSYPRRKLTVAELARKKHDDLKIISLQDYSKLMSLIDPDDPYCMPVNISFYTGLRRGEVAGLEWSNVDLENKTVKVAQQLIQYSKGDVQVSTPKTENSYRTIPIGDKLVDMLHHQKLLQYKRKMLFGAKYIDNDFVCTKLKGAVVTPVSIQYMTAKYRKLSGINFNFHSFRHTHATMLVESGANWKDIQKRLGHSRLSTTMDTYAHVSMEKQVTVANQLEEYLKNAGI